VAQLRVVVGVVVALRCLLAGLCPSQTTDTLAVAAVLALGLALLKTLRVALALVVTHQVAQGQQVAHTTVTHTLEVKLAAVAVDGVELVV
jgi:hypothetical protein